MKNEVFRALKENVWSSILRKYSRHLKWQKTRIRFFESNKCEIASCLYPLSGLADNKKFLRVAFIRTKKINPKAEDKHSHHYYAIVTDMTEAEKSNEHVIKFYRKRSDFAYNLMRYASFTIAPLGGCFVQTTRKKLVMIAGEIISHARSIEIRIMDYVFKEVARVRRAMNFIEVDTNRLRPKEGFKT